MAQDWREVCDQCRTWQYEVEAAVLVPGQTEDERRRVVEQWLKPIEAVSGAAMEMTADPDDRCERRRIRARALVKRLQHEADWVFKYGLTSFAGLPVFDSMMTGVVDRIADLFVEAASYDIDLSVSRDELETGDFSL
jgi:hypothetical protein